ncbi:malonic semialdehyde reductase [Nesterenkonia muleiensis]|uniref:malonic semialdehyde reductase n=1 Tax=Nesterenkonia muleiensis TaxID=2282648 RepID=UPI000E72AB0F|nr:malonic semialdehyde reductase [Nesterenkonia muleiensis]
MTVETVGRVVAREALDALFTHRHTTNTFIDTPVEAELIRAAYDDARLAPVSMNSQPLRLTLVQQGQSRQALVEQMMGGNKEKTVAAPLSIVVAYDPAWHLHMDELFPAIPGVKDTFESQPENRHAMGRDNASIQLGYFLVALRAHGLEVGPMAGLDAAGIDALFHSETGWKTIAVVNVGHAPNPDDAQAQFPRGKRLDFADISQLR